MRVYHCLPISKLRYFQKDLYCSLSSSNMGTRVKSGSTETLDQLHDEVASLKTALSEKESALRNLICTHEKLKTSLKEEIAKLEADKRDLISSLDEANVMRDEREGTVRTWKEEIERLRAHLSEFQKKCKQTEEWARSGKEAKFREELLMQFEEERNKVEDQLKWKCEQFAHLEEAHKKLQSEFRELKRDKEAEKLEFLGKISELESVLDEKTRLAEDLRARLEICNQILAREESKRKLLEAELHESRDQYDNLVTDFEAAKSAVESVTAKRDEDIASLRGILADKSLQIKEIELEKTQINQENCELRASLKEYREIEIGGVEKSKKFRALEKAHKGCGEKIKKREADIENLKRDLDDKIAQLQEKEQVVENLQNELKAKEEIRAGEVDMDGLKGDEVNNLQKRFEALLEERDILLCEHKGCSENIEKREAKIENLKRDLDDKIARLHEKEQLVENLQNQLKKIRAEEVDIDNLKGDEINNLQKRMEVLLEERERLLCEHKVCGEKIEKREAEIENLKRDLDEKIVRLHEKEQLVENLQNELKEKEDMDDLKGDEVNNLQKREKALLEEREMLLCELREKNDLVEQVKECMGREKALVRENERLISEARESEGVIKQLNAEIVKLLEKENDRLFCEDEERKRVMKEHKKCKERLDSLVKEKEMLLGEVRQREGVAEQLRECRDREEALLRERERFICETREREGLIEALHRDIALSREHNSRLESEICSHEEEKRKYAEIRNEMAKKLLELKFKLDPLEKKCTEVAKEKKNEISGLEMNLELLIEELESSVSENEELQLELQEMTTSYYLQRHEMEFREGLFYDLERQMEYLKINLRVKEDRFDAQLKRERLENEVKRVRFSNDMKKLLRERENLALQIDHLNCGIGSLFSADREINAIVERIEQNMRNEDEHTYEKKSKLLVPPVGTRSPLKENNF